MFDIKLCDVGVTIRGQNYDFLDVESFVIENPQRVRLVRGANARNKLGLIYQEGIKEAYTVTITAMNLPKELHDLLKDVHQKQERLDAYCIVSSGFNEGSSKIAKNGILSQEPMQLSLDDSQESMNLTIVIETYDVSEKLKENA